MRGTFGTRHQQQVPHLQWQDTSLRAVAPQTVTPSRGWSHPAPLTLWEEIWSAKSCHGSCVSSKLDHHYPFNTVPPAVQALQMAFTAPEITVLAEKGISSQLSRNTRSSLWTYYQRLWASTQWLLVLWFQGTWVGKGLVSSSADRHVSSLRVPVSAIVKHPHNLLPESFRPA